MFRALLIFGIGFLIADQLESRILKKKRQADLDTQKKRHDSLEEELDRTLNDSFPASDPPSFSHSPSPEDLH